MSGAVIELNLARKIVWPCSHRIQTQGFLHNPMRACLRFIQRAVFSMTSKQMFSPSRSQSSHWRPKTQDTGEIRPCERIKHTRTRKSTPRASFCRCAQIAFLPLSGICNSYSDCSFVTASCTHLANVGRKQHVGVALPVLVAAHEIRVVNVAWGKQPVKAMKSESA